MVSQDGIIARLAAQIIIAVVAVQSIIARAAGQKILAARPPEIVVTTPSCNCIIVVISIDTVRTTMANKTVICRAVER